MNLETFNIIRTRTLQAYENMPENLRVIDIETYERVISAHEKGIFYMDIIIAQVCASVPKKTASIDEMISLLGTVEFESVFYAKQTGLETFENMLDCANSVITELEGKRKAVDVYYAIIDGSVGLYQLILQDIAQFGPLEDVLKDSGTCIS